MHPAVPDPRNASILVHVGGRLVPRGEARVSVFDASVQGGDAVWEGLRVYAGRVFQLDEHVGRLLASAKALAFDGVPTRADVKRAVFETFVANDMRDGAHARLTLTRGEKITSGMNPLFNRAGTCLIVLAEWKALVRPETGVKWITASVRRNAPACLDSRIHHANLLNNILAKIEANHAGADDALMLDVEGFVAETNAANVFLVRKGSVSTPFADHCLPGITRALVIELCRAADIACVERRLTLADFHTADEVFSTGTLGALTPVAAIDGRTIADAPGPITRRLSNMYAERARSLGELIPFAEKQLGNRAQGSSDRGR
ncbi:MAG: aminotransferase class IV [Planctomycetota bacterium]|nr:aminotransferase class IV [Planctomycetota bacterium]